MCFSYSEMRGALCVGVLGVLFEILELREKLRSSSEICVRSLRSLIFEMESPVMSLPGLGPTTPAFFSATNECMECGGQAPRCACVDFATDPETETQVARALAVLDSSPAPPPSEAASASASASACDPPPPAVVPSVEMHPVYTVSPGTTVCLRVSVTSGDGTAALHALSIAGHEYLTVAPSSKLIVYSSVPAVPEPVQITVAKAKPGVVLRCAECDVSFTAPDVAAEALHCISCGELKCDACAESILVHPEDLGTADPAPPMYRYADGEHYVRCCNECTAHFGDPVCHRCADEEVVYYGARECSVCDQSYCAAHAHECIRGVCEACTEPRRPAACKAPVTASKSLVSAPPAESDSDCDIVEEPATPSPKKSKTPAAPKKSKPVDSGSDLDSEPSKKKSTFTPKKSARRLDFDSMDVDSESSSSSDLESEPEPEPAKKSKKSTPITPPDIAAAFVSIPIPAELADLIPDGAAVRDYSITAMLRARCPADSNAEIQKKLVTILRAGLLYWDVTALDIFFESLGCIPTKSSPIFPLTVPQKRFLAASLWTLPCVRIPPRLLAVLRYSSPETDAAHWEHARLFLERFRDSATPAINPTHDDVITALYTFVCDALHTLTFPPILSFPIKPRNKYLQTARARDVFSRPISANAQHQIERILATLRKAQAGNFPSNFLAYLHHHFAPRLAATKPGPKPKSPPAAFPPPPDSRKRSRESVGVATLPAAKKPKLTPKQIAKASAAAQEVHLQQIALLQKQLKTLKKSVRFADDA
jgi:hypothetical protein